MKIKGLIDADFVNYKKPSLYIATCFCDWKCCSKDPVCQNLPLAKEPEIEIGLDKIFKLYQDNPITSSIVVAGLEPFLQTDDLLELVSYFRSHGCLDDFVIYTGYYQEEIKEELDKLKKFVNIIVKFGRFIPDDTPRYDELLGVTLASSNQFAKKVS